MVGTRGYARRPTVATVHRISRAWGTSRAAGGAEPLPGDTMQSSWAMATTVVEIDGRADLLGERHRIIANDRQAANLNRLWARLLERSGAPGRPQSSTDA